MDCDSDLDADMLYSGSLSSSPLGTPPELTPANLKVVDFIEQTFDSIICELETRRPDEVWVELKRVDKRNSKVGSLKDDSGDSGDSEGHKTPRIRSRRVRYHWPGKSAGEAWRFTCLLRIFNEIRTAILDGMIVTKRDIYYRDPELFKKQATVDRWIDDIALTCGVTRKDLMVTASPKGLICGLSDLERVQTVPQDLGDITIEDVEHLKWILVVEKEASFKALVEAGFDQSHVLGQGLLVTAKGYPDLSTRLFLRRILDACSLMSPVPIFGLFDGDTDGLEIYRCFQSGSKSSVQGSACNLPELRWLGVDVCEFLGQPDVMKAAVALTARDRTRAVSMVSRLRTGRSDDHDVKVRRSLQTLLILDKKMEIQAIDKVDGGLCRWLEAKMLVARQLY